MLPIESETLFTAARASKPATRLDNLYYPPVTASLSPSSLSPSGAGHRSRLGSTCGWAVSSLARRLCNSPLRSKSNGPRTPGSSSCTTAAHGCGLALVFFSAFLVSVSLLNLPLVHSLRASSGYNLRCGALKTSPRPVGLHFVSENCIASCIIPLHIIFFIITLSPL